MIEKNTDLYIAIENAVLSMFNGEIPMEDPFETTKMMVESINSEISNQDE